MSCYIDEVERVWRHSVLYSAPLFCPQYIDQVEIGGSCSVDVIAFYCSLQKIRKNWSWFVCFLKFELGNWGEINGCVLGDGGGWLEPVHDAAKGVAGTAV